MANEKDKSVAEDDFSRVVANLTHELKTPLHSMLAVASVLRSEVDGSLTTEQQRQVDIIIRNGEQLLELITDLLQFSSTSTTTRRLNLRRFDVRSFFDHLIGAIRPVAEKGNVSISTETEKLQRWFVSDKTLLQRIVGNLLSNAVKFSPDGGEISCFAETTKDGSLHVQIADSGIGMPPEVVKQIFSQFYQGDSGDAKRFGGVGLGLALVQKSLELLGGAIEVQSEPGQGSLFTIRIPSAEHALETRKVLIVDSDASVRLSLKECLGGEGYQVCFVDEAGDVLSQIAELRPDLVMLDVAQDGRGFTQLADIRTTSWGRDLPILLMSALDGPQERGKGFELGASDFIVKPFDLAELIARVRSQVERPW
ncbi:MAG: response regulator [Bdellovibrionales bacterium]|nr:response regulator [Bdellovibrionales bacterium]